MYLDTLLSIFALMAKLKVLFIVSNIGDNQSLKLSRCFPMNIRGSGAYQLLPIQLFFYKISMCAYILVNLRALWMLYSTPNRSRSRLDYLLSSLSCLQFHMRGQGGGVAQSNNRILQKISTYFQLLINSRVYGLPQCLHDTFKF